MPPSDLERIDARLPSEQKRLIEEAAALSGLSVAGFVVSSAVEHARAVIESSTRTELSLENARRFLDILDDAKPSAALRAAAKRHKARRARR